MQRIANMLGSMGLLAGVAAASAQTPYPSTQQGVPGVPPMLQRVDPTYGDVSPLGDSLRSVDMQQDLRSPTGFQNVYRMPGRDDLLMRASGGIYAIFPQSVYVSSSNGPAALVPPGTVFSIGMPGPWSMPSYWVRGPERQAMMVEDVTAGGRSMIDHRALWTGSLPIDARQDHRRGGFEPVHDQAFEVYQAEEDLDARPRSHVVAATPPDPATFLKTIVTSEDYRASRMAELLSRAARAAERDNPQP